MTYPFVQADADYGRRKGPVKAFLVHMAEGGGTVGFLSRPNIRNVSVHYVIEYTGRIVQMLREDHASGSVNPQDIRTTDDADGFYGVTAAKAVMGAWWSDPNSAVISVEVEGYASAGPNHLQAVALEKLVADVRTRFPGMGLLGHRDFTSRKACPGKHIDWTSLGGHGPAGEEVDIPVSVNEPLDGIVSLVPGVGLYETPAGAKLRDVSASDPATVPALFRADSSWIAIGIPSATTSPARLVYVKRADVTVTRSDCSAAIAADRAKAYIAYEA